MNTNDSNRCNSPARRTMAAGRGSLPACDSPVRWILQAAAVIAVVTNYDIWQNNPEKVLGITAQFAKENPNTVIAVTKALIRSRRGELTADALLTASVQPRQIFIPMHFPETNRLTSETFDPVSRQPAYKSCAVSPLKTHA